MAVFHGERHAPRLSHYFMPRLALEGKRILFLDGANCADPRLMARLAEHRGIPFCSIQSANHDGAGIHVFSAYRTIAECRNSWQSSPPRF